MLSETADPQRAPELLVLRERIRSWRFYDHLRTDARPRRGMVQVGTRTPVLSHDGADLAAALQTIREIGDDRGPGRGGQPGLPRQPRRDHRAGRPVRAGPAPAGPAAAAGAAELSDGTLRYRL
jgi:hypothetical protein